MHPSHPLERNEQVRGVVTKILAAGQVMKKNLVWSQAHRFEEMVKKLPKVNF